MKDDILQREGKSRPKVLYCASTASHIRNFHLPYLKKFHDEGVAIHVAVDEKTEISYADKVFGLHFRKRLVSSNNIYALFQLYKIIKREKYDAIISNTTLAGVIVRISLLFLRKRPRVCHIVHGYIFDMDSGLRKYLYLIPEKIAALVSDVVFVMNDEDLQIATRYHLYKEQLHHIDGMGLDISRFTPLDEEKALQLRSRMGLRRENFVYAYAAEFSKRKNHTMLIRAFAQCYLENAVLLLAGEGETLPYCKKLALELDIAERVRFLGHVTNIFDVFQMSDIVVSASTSEGLPFNIMEGMYCSRPILASNIKGHRDLVEQSKNGFLFDKNRTKDLAHYLECLYNMDNEKLNGMGSSSRIKVDSYLLHNVFNINIELMFKSYL